MKENIRNITVGITVLIALALLAGMIIIFTGLPEIFQGGYLVEMRFENTGGVHTGDLIFLKGMEVGRVTDIAFADPGNPDKGIKIVSRIKQGSRLPGNVQAYVFSKGFVGGTYLELKTDGPQRIDPKTGKVMEFLPTDQVSVIPGVIKPGGGLIPDELLDTVKKLGALAENINAMVTAPPPPEETPVATQASTQTAPSGPPPRPTLQGTIAKLNRALDGINAVLGDVENQANIKTALTNLAKATATANDAMVAVKDLATEGGAVIKQIHGPTTQAVGRLDELTAKLIDSAEKVSKLMTVLNQVAMKMNSDTGTAGKLLNDPALYNSLLDATKQLNELMSDFREMVKTWNDKGIPLKLK